MWGPIDGIDAEEVRKVRYAASLHSCGDTCDLLKRYYNYWSIVITEIGVLLKIIGIFDTEGT